MNDDFSPNDLAAIDAAARRLGLRLFEQLRRPHVLQRRWWDNRIMSWAMRDDSLKVALFRFVDVLPMLRTDEAVIRHLNEYLHPVADRLPAPVRAALGLARRVPAVRPAVAGAARLAAMDLARRFIAGADARRVLNVARRQRRRRRCFTLDILGEAVASRREADCYLRAYCELIENVAPTVNAWPEVAQIDRDRDGPLPRMNLSVKLSALDSRFDPIDPAGATRRIGRRLRELLRVAREHRALVNIDMESYEKKDLTLHIFKTILAEEEFRETADVGIAVQCYLTDTASDVAALRDWAVRRGTPIWVRLVKGAYWDHETSRAVAAGRPVPVYQKKWQSDAEFERQTRFVMKSHRHLRPALASHNLRSIAYGLTVAEHLGLPDGRAEIQMLYGMADAEAQSLVDLGQRVRIYMPYGELIPGMGYLVRRLLENTSNDSFLRAGFLENVPADELLKDPVEVGREQEAKAVKSVPTRPDPSRPPADSIEASAESPSPPTATSAGRCRPGLAPRCFRTSRRSRNCCPARA